MMIIMIMIVKKMKDDHGDQVGFVLLTTVDNWDYCFADQDDQDDDDHHRGIRLGLCCLPLLSDLSPAAPLAVAIAILQLNMMRI